MPRRKQVSDEQLVSVARQVFLRAGAKAPVSLIAKALGVTSAALFHRAGTKKRLMISAMTLSDPREYTLLELLQEGPRPDEPVREQLIDILVRLATHLAIVTPCMLLMHSAGMKFGKRRELPGKTRSYLANWLRRAQRLGDLDFGNATMAAEALVGTMEARNMFRYLDGKPVALADERVFARSLIAEILAKRATIL
jgi:AcrR family transcriptional regulator